MPLYMPADIPQMVLLNLAKLLWFIAIINYKSGSAAASRETATEEPGTGCIPAVETIAGGSCLAETNGKNQAAAGTAFEFPEPSERDIFVLKDEVTSRLEALGKVSDDPSILVRTYMSPAFKEAVGMVRAWMNDAGLTTWVDGIGNVHGRVEAADGGKHRAALVLGSHIDTVRDAGKFDGTLGVVASIAAVKVLLASCGAAATCRLARPLEVVAFCDEEGVRFQSTFLGSRAMAGTLTEEVLASRGADGRSLKQVLADNGQEPSVRALRSLAYAPSRLHAYVELHIEQGPVLEAAGVPLGVVSAIAGQARLAVAVAGRQGHAGTVPMALRRDAGAAAAEMLVAVERACLDQGQGGADDGLVATTGVLALWPGASNVIPGKAEFTVDVRSRNDTRRMHVVADIRRRLAAICARRGVMCEVVTKHEAPAVPCDPSLMLQLSRAAQAGNRLAATAARAPLATSTRVSEEAGTKAQQAASPPSPPPPPLVMVSGAGHDGLAMAEVTRIGMLFVRCLGGVSHSPLEHVSADDILASGVALVSFLREELTGG